MVIAERCLALVLLDMTMPGVGGLQTHPFLSAVLLPGEREIESRAKEVNSREIRPPWRLKPLNV